MERDFIAEIKEVLNVVESDYVKFVKGNKSAGTRVRVGSMKIKSLLSELRTHIQATKNNHKGE